MKQLLGIFMKYMSGTMSCAFCLKKAILVIIVVTGLLAVCPAAPMVWSAENLQADRVLVLKAKRKMILYRGDTIIAAYKIALGRSPKGHKTKRGDGKTPEGKYTISGRNPKSSFHLSLRISYPRPQDVTKAGELGVDPGGDIMIHGLPPKYAFLGSLHRLVDWTEGCIAVTNEEIENIWKMVPVGTPIEIKP
jgi:murein L,D-transpeptidase YafK